MLSNFRIGILCVVAIVLAVSLGFASCSNTNSIGQIGELLNFEISPDDDNELKPLITQVIKKPRPFRANDGLIHLVYELQIENFTTETVDLNTLTI